MHFDDDMTSRTLPLEVVLVPVLLQRPPALLLLLLVLLHRLPLEEVAPECFLFTKSTKNLPSAQKQTPIFCKYDQ